MREKAVKRFINEQSFEEAYRVGAVLGKGGFGIVYAGVRSKDKREVAIKHVARNKVEHWANLNGKRVPLELKLLHSVQTVSGVIRLLDFYERKDSFIYVMERPSNVRDMFDFITEKGALEEEVSESGDGYEVKQTHGLHASSFQSVTRGVAEPAAEEEA